MGVNEIHCFDAATKFEVQILQEDRSIYSLEGSNVLKFIFQKPDGSLINRTGTFVTDGMDGKVKYITNDTDLDQPGTWRYQVYIEKGPVEKYSDVGSFRVFQNLPFV